jgi:hypothetical protein
MRSFLKVNKTEIRVSFDSFSKSDAKPFGQLLTTSCDRTVIQIWTDNCKIEQIMKLKNIKATKEYETPIGPDEKAVKNNLACDTNENIFVIRGLRSHLQSTRNLRLLHFVNLRLSHDGWNTLSNGITENKSLYKFALNQCCLIPDFVQMLSPALGKHPNIETIDLSANGIEDD